MNRFGVYQPTRPEQLRGLMDAMRQQQQVGVAPPMPGPQLGEVQVMQATPQAQSPQNDPRIASRSKQRPLIQSSQQQPEFRLITAPEEHGTKMISSSKLKRRFNTAPPTPVQKPDIGKSV